MNGLGSFASGLVSGYTTGTGLRLQQEKADREKQEFDFQQQQRQLDKEVRESTAKSLAELQARYENPQPAAEGQEPVKMSPAEYFYEQQKVIATGAQRLGKFDTAHVENLRKSFENVRFEGLRDAMTYGWSRPDDVDGVRKRLKKAGVDIPEGMVLKKVPIDPNDPQSGEDLVGFRIGPDGKEIKEFSFMETIPMVASAEVMLKDFMQTKNEVRGLRATSREKALDRKTTIDAAVISASGKGKDGDAKVREELIKQLYAIPEGRFKALLGNAANALTPEIFEQSKTEMFAMAEDLVLNKGVPPYKAFVLATETQKRMMDSRKGVQPPKK